MNRETIALNMMEIDSRVSMIHDELEELHDMKDVLRAQLENTDSQYPMCTFYENKDFSE